MNFRYLRFGLFGLSLGLAVLLIIQYQLKNTPISYVENGETAQIDKPKIGGDFTLMDHHGKIRHSDEFKNKIKLIYFGYSFCPDVCPMGLQNMSQALNQIGRDIDQVAPIFITIDPERDTVKLLHAYAQNWHPSFIFLTGSSQDIQKSIKDFKVYAAKATPDNTVAEYLMDHSTLIYIMDDDGKFIEALPHTTEPTKISHVLKNIFISRKKGKTSS